MSGRRFNRSRGRGRSGSMRSSGRSYGGFGGGSRGFGGGGGFKQQRSFSNNRRRPSSSSSSSLTSDYHARASRQRLINHH